MTLLMTPATFQSAYAAELVTNGSFEDPDIADVSFQVFAAISGWTSTIGPGLEIQDSIAGEADAGNGEQFAELDSTDNSNMIQTLTTVADEGYILTFDYSPRCEVSAASNGIEVYWDGNLIATITDDGLACTATDWNTHQFLVTATGASTDLEFRAVGTSDRLGGYIDVVSVIDNDMICEDTFGGDWAAHNSTLTEDTQSDDFIYVLKCLDTTDPCLDPGQGVELKHSASTTCNGFGSVMFSNVVNSTMKDALPAEWTVDTSNDVTFLFGDNCTVEGKKGMKARGATVFECDGADLSTGLFGAAVQVSDIMTVASPSNGKRNSCDGENIFKPTSFVLFANEGVQGTVFTPQEEVRQIDNTPGDLFDDDFSDFFAMTEALPAAVVANEPPCQA